jgi:outer membrane protein OmpA-like peptidoglycan-associated protein
MNFTQFLSEAKEGKNQATVSTVGQEESKDYNNLLLLIPVKVTPPIKLPKILYELNSAKLTPMAIDSLQGLLQTLNENPEIVIQLESHTDARGSNKANEKLSQARSQSVVDWLITLAYETSDEKK